MVRETKTALAKKLVHDVGKYISRAARNMSDADSYVILHEMFVDDLYRTDGAGRASVVFADVASRLEGMIGKNAALDRCRELLLRIDVLETSVREKKNQALCEAAEAAVAVDDTLRGLLSELQTEDNR